MRKKDSKVEADWWLNPPPKTFHVHFFQSVAKYYTENNESPVIYLTQTLTSLAPKFRPTHLNTPFFFVLTTQIPQPPKVGHVYALPLKGYSPLQWRKKKAFILNQ